MKNKLSKVIVSLVMLMTTSVLVGTEQIVLATDVHNANENSTTNNESEANMTELVIEAQDFTMPLSDVSSLTAETAMDENHAQVSARLGLAMIFIYPTVNEAELATIQNAQNPGVYPLTFYAEYPGQSVETTIQVTVEDSGTMVAMVAAGIIVVVGLVTVLVVTMKSKKE